jgi:signal peptidase II
MNPRFRVALALTILLMTVACDQGTKRWARAALDDGRTVDLLDEHVELSLAENRGAFLSVGERFPAPFRFLVFTVFVAIGLAVALRWLFARTSSWIDATLLSLLIGGGIGNLIDRATRSGAVTDFVILRFASLHTGVFNVADVCVLAGAGLLFAVKIRPSQTPRRAP